ncbi:MAG TPA: hypothetical protein VF861_06780 [Telluria sp.]
MTAHFDPLEYAQQLETAGVPKAQAEVHARTLGQVIDDCAAGSEDLSAIKDALTHRIAETETRLRALIAETDMGLRALIAETDMGLRALIAETEGRLGKEIVAVEMRLRKEIAETEIRLKEEISKVERALRGEIQAVETRLNVRISAVEKEIASLRAEMRFHRWATGATFVLLAGIYIQLLFR